MKISTLNISNFRSIKELSIEPSQLCALIGPNGAGKTSVLKALDLLIGEGWTTKAKVARELFNDPTQNIEIEAIFETPVSFTGSRGHRNDIESIKLEMSLIPGLSAKTTVNGGGIFYDQEIFKKLCHFIYIPSERQLTSELRVSQWTMLGKLMRQIYENYVEHYGNDADRLKAEFETTIEPAKEFLQAPFSTSKLTFHKFSEIFVDFCEKNSAGLATAFTPSLNIYNINWFYKTLQIHVNEGSTEYFDCEQLGSGMQNLLMISIFQTYSKLMGGTVIFGIEEPEIYLYPHAQRSLYTNLIQLSDETQFFYTTHNPNFVDAARPDDIQLLRKTNDLGTYPLEKSSILTTENVKDDFDQIYTHFNPERNEIFFAKRILLVEGDSDKILFTTLAEKLWRIDLNRSGISIIACDGKAGVNYFAGVCKLLGHDSYFAVWDQDDDDYQPSHDNLANLLSNNQGLEIPINLESLLSLPGGNGSRKVRNAYNWAVSATDTSIPDEFNNVLEFMSQEAISDATDEQSSSDSTLDEIADDVPF